MSMKLTVNAAGFNNSVHMGTKDGQSVRTVKTQRSAARQSSGRSSGKAPGGSEEAGVEGRGKCVEKRPVGG